jgi:hypothetical protein
MKLIHVALLAVAPIFAFAQTPAPKAPASTPAPAAAPKVDCKLKKNAALAECKPAPKKPMPKAPKPTDKQLEDAKKKAAAKK